MTSESTDGRQRGFNHPFLQACGMFLGEMMCMVVFKMVTHWRKRKVRLGQREPDAPPTPFSPFVFLPPALCDMTATSIQYIALTLTYASSFQMLRGAVIVFTGIFSRLVLKNKLFAYKWLGIVFVIGGLATVGICDMLYIGDGGGHNMTQVQGGRSRH
jgi:drug/metabolite transporter (DMT)-like permease